MSTGRYAVLSRYPARRTLVALAVAILVASIAALPATAARGGKAKHPIPAACKSAAVDAAKSFRQSRRDAIQAFHQQQKAARVAFRSQQPAPTLDQRKAFRQQQRAALTAFVQQERAAFKAFRQSQLASLKACAG
jgi:hypothetical protein